jgi:hypothetical protein
VLDWGPRYGPGSQIVTPHGRYEIGAVSPWDGAAGTPAGTVWITAYSDAGALGGPVSLTVQSGAARGGAPAAGLGLGNEVEYAWNGSAWAAFGEGGARQVNADLRQSFFAWYFQANSGDLYTGWLIDLSWKAQAGDTQTTPAGRFVIQQETEFGRDIGVQNGTVWTTGYFDSASASWLPTRNYYQLAASSGQAGLGSELDTAWDGTAWQLFGQGGARQVDKLPPDSFYGWYFQARSGDLYMGFTIDLTSRWQPGDRITTPYGQYVIESEAEYGWTTGLGRTVWTTAYFDAGTSRWLSTQNYYVYRGSSSQAGLGQELDHAWDGAAWQLFGQGGLYQANGLPGAASDPFG